MARSLSRSAQLAIMTVLETLNGRENVPVSEVAAALQTADFDAASVEKVLKTMSAQGHITVSGEGEARTFTAGDSGNFLFNSMKGS